MPKVFWLSLGRAWPFVIKVAGVGRCPAESLAGCGKSLSAPRNKVTCPSLERMKNTTEWKILRSFTATDWERFTPLVNTPVQGDTPG